MCPQPIKKSGPFQKPRSKTVRKRGERVEKNKKVNEEDGDLKT